MFCHVIIFLILWKFVLPFVIIIFNYTLGKLYLSKRKSIKEAGEWAIITGCTAGIGRAYATELAKDSLNIVLISRDKQKLDELEKEIKEKYKVKTKVIVADFTQVDIYEQIKTEIDKLSSVACLVNNVGMSYNYLTPFNTTDFMNLEFIKRLILCNDLSTASMTHIALQKMSNQKGPNNAKPVIINVGSASGVHNVPYLSLYSATKAFMLCFANCLRWEKENENVLIQTVYPFYVQTALTKIKRSSLSVPKPEDYVTSALDMLGVEQSTYGYLYHALQGQLHCFIPQCILAWFMRSTAKKSMKKFKTT